MTLCMDRPRGTRTAEARRLSISRKRDTTKGKAAFPPLFEVRTVRMDAHDLQNLECELIERSRRQSQHIVGEVHRLHDTVRHDVARSQGLDERTGPDTADASAGP